MLSTSGGGGARRNCASSQESPQVGFCTQKGGLRQAQASRRPRGPAVSTMHILALSPSAMQMAPNGPRIIDTVQDPLSASIVTCPDFRLWHSPCHRLPIAVPNVQCQQGLTPPPDQGSRRQQRRARLSSQLYLTGPWSSASQLQLSITASLCSSSRPPNANSRISLPLFTHIFPLARALSHDKHPAPSGPASAAALLRPRSLSLSEPRLFCGEFYTSDLAYLRHPSRLDSFTRSIISTWSPSYSHHRTLIPDLASSRPRSAFQSAAHHCLITILGLPLVALRHCRYKTSMHPSDPRLIADNTATRWQGRDGC